MPRSTHPRSKVSAIVCATMLAAAVSASAKDDETRTCKTTFGGQVVCGNLTIGITLEQYEAGLKKRAEEIRSEEAEKRVQLQKLMERPSAQPARRRTACAVRLPPSRPRSARWRQRAKGLLTGLQICRRVTTGWCRSWLRPIPRWRRLRR